ncbi:hypothetical protein [Jongsikchunia kroppenstedtii]|uniref:hypothetical protein n=1 Tax=Jongsikchunia kroppenstedtii TaxID=1121721 RepID=UPI000362C27E|nr:hypothetical protein [Jongsikchunia kroppenstedtii]
MNIKRLVAGGLLAGAVALGGIAVGAGAASAAPWHHPGPVHFAPRGDWHHDRYWQPGPVYGPGPIFLPPAPPNIFGS